MIVQVAEMQISWSWCQLSEPGNSRNRKWENALFILIILNSRSRLSPPVHRIEYYTSQHTCITQYRRHSTGETLPPATPVSDHLSSLFLCAHVRVSHSWALFSSQLWVQERKLLSVPEHLSEGARSSDTRSLSPIRYDIVTVTLSAEGDVSSPSIHHRPYLRNRKCPSLMSFKTINNKMMWPGCDSKLIFVILKEESENRRAN